MKHLFTELGTIDVQTYPYMETSYLREEVNIIDAEQIYYCWTDFYQ